MSCILVLFNLLSALESEKGLGSVWTATAGCLLRLIIKSILTRGLRTEHALSGMLPPPRKWHKLKWDVMCYLNSTKVHSSMYVYLLEERPKSRI